jgi:hypothetical protein
MTHNKSTEKRVQKTLADEHTLLQQEDFQWLGELHDALSPYWSARLINRTDGVHPVLVLDGLQQKDRE